MTVRYIPEHTQKIADLNDSARQDHTVKNFQFAASGRVADMPLEKRRQLMELVRNFDDFTHKNDPHAEHDFGRVTVDGEHYIWKFDYYDLTMEYRSPDPSDPEKTIRVLTLMHNTEY